MKKRYDPLWEIVDEKVALQGQEVHQSLCCPHCHVPVDLSAHTKPGDKFLCGLCGTRCEIASARGDSEFTVVPAGERI